MPPGPDVRRQVPRTDAVLDSPALAEARQRLGRSLVRAAVGRAQQRVRDGALDPDLDVVVAAVLADLPPTASTLRPVINATGVLLHTNLGRAALSQAAVQAVVDAAGTTDVELDLATGRRARRGRGATGALAAAVPDAEAVHVVNNGAAALVLAATALAGGGLDRDVVMSRGEMVEVGDGFRLHELVASTGARLREVGTTNRTTAADVAAAFEAAEREGRRVGLVMKVHPSNFRVEGFTSAPSTTDLARVCAAAPGGPVPLLVDTGSGLLAPRRDLPDEPDAATALRAGADLVTASGDKLLGGPQAGLVLGRADLVERLRRHPLARALRVDKLTLAALEATLTGPPPPVLAALEADVDGLRERARHCAAVMRTADPELDVHVVDSEAVVGGGGAPGVVLPSVALSLPAAFAEPLRHPRRAVPTELGPVAARDPGPVGAPVLTRVEGGRCLLDLRAVPQDDWGALRLAVRLAARAVADPGVFVRRDA
ncbi:L-seryl-tRNA(Sec) selenium transferase [Streptomyces sp. NP160]|uniref:L-seryl-tRNA(Sec) selenium transferase n=1 Tax=Streptomyces sp. NP160 TaxID=2586637 RepID=UPI00111A0B2D|nr:L-seryl-tRNA(Sec) selenium transferase [Streptomyces sp. NP160]TNM61143.1 L-seryl-tRNA(Sec) selenium transferase [Streptomyces sp. NP160]